MEKEKYLATLLDNRIENFLRLYLLKTNVV